MKLILAGAVAALATPEMADDFPVRLKDGATWTITAEHSRAAEGMGPSNNWSLTTVKRLTWHAGKNGGAALLTVTPVSAKPGEGSPPELAQARSLGIPATFSVDENLEPGGFINGEEVRAEFVRLAPNAKGSDPKLIDASAKAMVATELVMMAHGQGLALKPGASLSADVPIANPLGGPPVRGVVTEKLETYDRAAGAAEITWSQALDAEAFKMVVAAMIADLGKRQLPPEKLVQARAALQSAAYDNRTYCRFEVDTRTGLARRAECTMTNSVSIRGKTQRVVDTWTISQTLPDKI